MRSGRTIRSGSIREVGGFRGSGCGLAAAAGACCSWWLVVITLTTGVPGSGKTLYTLNYVKALSEKEGRPVYYSGIAQLALSWHEIESPELWFELPEGAIIVVDEAQRLFRPRGQGSHVPPHVAQLETHRHKGFDIFLVTQHPMLIDSNIRRLVGQHFHVIRRFGGQRAVVHEFTSCSEITKGAMQEAVRHDFAYPKESFSWYKSAEVHTHKRRVPMRVYFLWASPVLVVGLFVLAFHYATRASHATTGAAVAKGAASVAGVADQVGGVGRGPGASAHVETRGEYLAARAPRLANLAYTAPVYDELTKPVRVPRPAACVATRGRCRCYTQDATLLQVDDAFCRDVVARGVFLDFEPDPVASVGVAPNRGAQNGPGGAGGSGVVPGHPATSPGSLPAAQAPSGGRSAPGGGVGIARAS